MSYLAIARKYRPATFDEIVGQEHVTRTLKNAIERDRVHHAFLFTGARGVGKTTAARALARALNCVEGPTPEPCGECTSCTEISTGSSPDLIEIDGASNNSVDDIRDLRDTVQYAPTAGRSKIYLIDEVHMLSKGAFNALLKTLEEPPSHVVFVFATTEPNRIPDTILSRVQRFDFKRIPAMSVADRLKDIATKEGAVVSDNALRLIARAGEGSMRDAQSLLDQVLSFAGPDVTDAEVAETLGLIDTRLLHDMLDGMVGGEPGRCLEVIDTVYGYGFELSQFTAELLEQVRNLTLLRLSESSKKYVDLPDEEIEELEQIGNKVAPEALSRLFTALLDVHDQVSRAQRPRIVLEMAVARLATVRPVHPVGQLVGRLEELERRMRTGGGGGAPGGGGMRPRGGRSLSRNRTPKMQFIPPAARSNAQPERPQPALEARAPAPRPAPSRSREMPPAPPLEHTITPSMPEVEEINLEATPQLKWTRFCEALTGTEAEAITLASPRLTAQVLELTFSNPRRGSMAAKLVDHPLVVKALRAQYGPNCKPTIIWESTRKEDTEANLKRRVMADPEFTRVLDALDGKLRTIRALSEGDDS
ncbi:MAG: DNA polymerase III subunit gamma/tau [Proteobacteria bacterium]|nr:DNA polymerase III subunit gamma/tau [Pseudomonadota bacterium]